MGNKQDTLRNNTEKNPLPQEMHKPKTYPTLNNQTQFIAEEGRNIPLSGIVNSEAVHLFQYFKCWKPRGLAKSSSVHIIRLLM